MEDVPGDGREEIGSVAEETVKLLAALKEWAQESGDQHAATASAAAQGLKETMSAVGDHVGHGPDCRYCPVCQVINVVRDLSPEVRQHLADAGNALLQAAQGLLATPAPSRQEPD